MQIRVLALSKTGITLAHLEVTDQLVSFRDSLSQQIQEILSRDMNEIHENNSIKTDLVSKFSFKEYKLLQTDGGLELNDQDELDEIISEVSKYPANILTLVGLDSSLVKSFNLTLPIADTKKALEASILELEDLLPFDLDRSNYHITQTVLNQNKEFSASTKTSISVKIISNQDFEDVLGLISRIGLNPQLICDLQSLGGDLFSSLAVKEAENLALVDLSEFDTNLSFFSAGNLIKFRSFLNSTEESLRIEQLKNHLVEDNANLNSTSELLIIDRNGNLKLPDPQLKIIKLRSIIENNSNTIEPSQLNSNEASYLYLAAICFLAELSRLQVTSEQGLNNHKKIRINNLRIGKYRYKAPFSELKESIIGELVPIALFLVFSILSLGIAVALPGKKLSVANTEAVTLAQSLAPDLAINEGESIASIMNKLSSGIGDLESQVGNLTSVQLLSPIDWYYKISKVLDKSHDFSLDSFSISTEGLIFRGTVKDYPTSGKLDSNIKKLVEEEPSIFCAASVTSEQGSGGLSAAGGRRSIVGEVQLCK